MVHKNRRRLIVVMYAGAMRVQYLDALSLTCLHTNLLLLGADALHVDLFIAIDTISLNLNIIMGGIHLNV